MKIMIVVTHLLGTGHLSRALMLARAFSAAGHTSIVVSGGMPASHLDVTGVKMIQLLPLRSDGVNFARLLDEAGDDASPDLLQNRMQHLHVALRAEAPDVLITELFPFGRRILKDEFLHLLDGARSSAKPPLVCASIRDILAPPSKSSKAVMTEAVIKAHYDAVLVHSDPQITPLNISWPVTKDLAPFLHYTGFVAPPPLSPRSAGGRSNDVLVSAGGGDVGAGLFASALDAAALDQTRKWHLLVGGANAQKRVSDLQRHALPNVVIEPARPDFRQLLQGAGGSVSMAGYNTALDVLQAGTPAVFVPFDAGGEVEQTLRAAALADLSGISVLANTDLSGSALVTHVEKVMRAAPRLAQTQNTDGARKTVQIVETLQRRAR